MREEDCSLLGVYRRERVARSCSGTRGLLGFRLPTTGGVAIRRTGRGSLVHAVGGQGPLRRILRERERGETAARLPAQAADRHAERLVELLSATSAFTA